MKKVFLLFLLISSFSFAAKIENSNYKINVEKRSKLSQQEIGENNKQIEKWLKENLSKEIETELFKEISENLNLLALENGNLSLLNDKKFLSLTLERMKRLIKKVTDTITIKITQINYETSDRASVHFLIDMLDSDIMDLYDPEDSELEKLVEGIEDESEMIRKMLIYYYDGLEKFIDMKAKDKSNYAQEDAKIDLQKINRKWTVR